MLLTSRQFMLSLISIACLLVTCQTVWAQGKSTPSQQKSPTAAANASIADMRKSVFNFWLQHGMDKQYGGFHATLDRQGDPISPTNKSIVQQARHLWALSALLESGKQPESAVVARARADNLLSFMKTHMMIQVPLNSTGGNGTGWVFETTRDGRTIDDPSLYIYANAAPIYALSKYAQATGSTKALELALQTFNALDALYHDKKTGGYDESSVKGPLAAELNYPLPGKNSAGLPQKSQPTNSLMHVIESLAELSRATNGSNPRVQARLLELLSLFTGPFVVVQGNLTFVAQRYDPRVWKPLNATYIDCGHNIQGAWLLADAVDQLQASGTINSTRAGDMKAVLQKFGDTAVRVCHDTQYGGLLEGSVLTQPVYNNKTWWIQAEALNGLDWLYNRTSQQRYKDMFNNVLKFVKDNFWDQQYGEWYWQVPREGGKPLPYTAGPPPSILYDAGVKGNVWKASYHTGRAMLRLESKGY